MGFEITVALLSVTLIGLPITAWIILRKIATADKQQKKKDEIRALENSLSLMIKELEDSVKKALDSMEDAAANLNQAIEQADDRVRQLQYYYEYGEELKPLVEPKYNASEIPNQVNQVDQAIQPSAQGHALRHKEVHELSRKGWSAAQIAKHTGMSADEVQLIVNLMEISTMDAQSTPHQIRQPMV